MSRAIIELDRYLEATVWIGNMSPWFGGKKSENSIHTFDINLKNMAVVSLPLCRVKEFFFKADYFFLMDEEEIFDLLFTMSDKQAIDSDKGGDSDAEDVPPRTAPSTSTASRSALPTPNSSFGSCTSARHAIDSSIDSHTVPSNIDSSIHRGKKTVSVISSMHNPSVETTVQRTNHKVVRDIVPCPVAVAQYDKFMGGVDRLISGKQFYSLHSKLKLKEPEAQLTPEVQISHSKWTNRFIFLEKKKRVHASQRKISEEKFAFWSTYNRKHHPTIKCGSPYAGEDRKIQKMCTLFNKEERKKKQHDS
ncbi:hypothetical protein J6590_094887 [Homalodisca vitripennis]|nr:hypothetical protein J6590_094887 [Homalodisca vitripennis]